MAIVIQRKVKIVATVTSNRQVNALQKFLTDNIFPQLVSRVTSHFSPIFKPATLQIPLQSARVNTLATRKYELYPQLYFIGELLEGLKEEPDFWGRWDAFIQDCQQQFQNGITSFGGITLVSMYYQSTTEDVVLVF